MTSSAEVQAFNERNRSDPDTWALVRHDPALKMLRDAIELIDNRGGTGPARAAEISARLSVQAAVLLYEKATYDRLAHHTEAVQDEDADVPVRA